jgi:glycosyltransferase involved in cell wall biosynthesis
MSSQKPKITVITPTYNRAAFIKETIESVLAQDYRDFEYLILDDGSTDNTKEIVKPFLKDKRVKYLYHSNQGEAEAVNWGWQLAQGEYFTQVNSDDPILPSLFREMVKVLDKKKDVVVAYPDFYFIDEKGRTIKEIKNPDWDFEQALCSFSCYAASPGTFINKHFFKEWKVIRNSKYKYINDVEMYWRMALEGNFTHIPKHLATWREHSAGISNTRWKSTLEVQNWLNDYFSQKNLPAEIYSLKEKTSKSVYLYLISLLSQANYGQLNKQILFYRSKLDNKSYKYSNLQISSRDLVGNKFNGHDLHLYLNERGVYSEQLVWVKESNDNKTYTISRSDTGVENIRKFFIKLHEKYSLDSICNIITYDILYSRKFLETDVVHYHLINDHFFDLQLLPLLTRLKPTVWTLHDPWVLGGHCVHHFDCQKWQQNCYDCPYLKTHFPLKKDNSALNFSLKKAAILNSNFDVIVASKWMEEKVKKSPMFIGKKVHKIPFGINQNVFKPLNKSECKKQFGVGDETIVLTFRYDESEFKGLDFIFYLLDHLNTTKKIHLFILGYHGNMAKSKYKFSHSFFSWVKDDKLLAKIYSATDLFLMPSKMETFGMMAIEAMSCKTLPIVIDGTALTEIVGAPEVGIVTKKTKESFAEIVNYYINHDAERLAKSSQCFSYAKGRYSYKKYVDNIAKIYEKVIKDHKLEKEDVNLLSQLKKNMAVDSDNSNKVYARDQLSAISKLFFMIFYKLDKFIPSKMRKAIKDKLMKINIFKKIFRFF